MTCARVFGAVALLVLAVAAGIGGWIGALYAFVFVLATAPGWPIGRRVFGAGHPAALIAGAILGYGLTAFALWVPIATGAAWWLPFLLAWATMTAVTWTMCRSPELPTVPLPAWRRDATLSLGAVLVLVPMLVWLPYSRIGERDEEGSRRYRAYFTADFVWHEALTAELARFDSPPRNPYMASQPLRYYWAYYLLPGAVTGMTRVARPAPPIETYLAVNALCTAVLFVAAIFLAAWAALPRGVLVGVATALALLASSAEGLYATVDLLLRSRPLAGLRDLNIDAITLWFFQGLTVDGLARSIWYTPQHSLACALGLIALAIAARAGAAMRASAAASAGLALGLALMMSPFLAGVMTLTYAIVVLSDTFTDVRRLARTILVQVIAAAIVLAALGWCLANGTFEGAGGAVAFGLSNRARRAPLTVLGLALGPVLVPASVGVVAAARDRFPQPVRPAVASLALGLPLFYFVTLVLEPVWIGWRAGQLILVTAPALIAIGIAAMLRHLGRGLPTALVSLLFAAGLPTTAIDLYNAQDTSNVAMGPGFRWTVVVTRDEQQAFDWIQRQTPYKAVVQMSLGPRGRETWSLIPSFARRRMAAGLPISLLRTPEYEPAAKRADRVYSSPDPLEAWQIARELQIDYLFVGRVEREVFGKAALKFDARHDLFELAFANLDAAVYAIK